MQPVGKPYFGGIPVAPDVRKLWEKFGVPEPGVIPHSEIEAVIGVGYRTSRYRTIVTSWRRKLLREANIDTEAEAGVGIKVLTHNQRVGVCVKTITQKTRQLVRATARPAGIDRDQLSEQNKLRHDCLDVYAARMRSDAQDRTKEFRSSLVAAVLPPPAD